ncbi:MAG: GTPase [Planctomycetota bacterium]
MAFGDTIVAVASAPSHGQRGVLRISGPHGHDALATLCAPRPTSAGLHTLSVQLPDAPAPFPACALLFRAGHSYTGEAAAELQLPGNPALLDRALRAILNTTDAPIRLARPGEFTARAFLAGRLTAEQAEGVQALIGARSAAEAHAATALLNGSQGDAYRAIADDIAASLALVEAGIDFTDQEDVVAIAAPELAVRLDAVAAAMDGLLGPGAREQRLGEPLVVLAGEPNAGKSTLFNALLGRQRSITSPTAGATRDVLEEELPVGSAGTWNGPRVRLADMAGLDTALAGAPAQSAAADALRRADVVLWCDPTGRFSPRPAWLDDTRVLLRVRTKGDLPAQPTDALSVCALDLWNTEALRRAIFDAAGDAQRTAHAATRGVLLMRHRQSLSDALHALNQANALLDAHEERIMQPELVAGALRDALDAVGTIAGHVHPDDVIGRIFATFCIGK